jgi:hypothetical protein
MGISDYRDKDFRVSFAGVTLGRCLCVGAARCRNLTAWHKAFLHFAPLFHLRQNCHLVKLRGDLHVRGSQRARSRASLSGSTSRKKKQPGSDRAVSHCRNVAPLTLSSETCFQVRPFKLRLASDRLTCRASRSDAQGGRPCGLRCSCERCCVEQHASARAPRRPSP